MTERADRAETDNNRAPLSGRLLPCRCCPFRDWREGKLSAPGGQSPTTCAPYTRARRRSTPGAGHLFVLIPADPASRAHVLVLLAPNGAAALPPLGNPGLSSSPPVRLLGDGRPETLQGGQEGRVYSTHCAAHWSQRWSISRHPVAYCTQLAVPPGDPS